MISIRKEIVVDDVVIVVEIIVQAVDVVVIVVEIIVQAVDVVVVNLVYYFIQIKIIKSKKKKHCHDGVV